MVWRVSRVVKRVEGVKGDGESNPFRAAGPVEL